MIKLYEAKIKMIDTGAKVKVDQIHVETVIPGLGKEITLVSQMSVKFCEWCPVIVTKNELQKASKLLSKFH